jgi:hypothetical protein
MRVTLTARAQIPDDINHTKQQNFAGGESQTHHQNSTLKKHSRQTRMPTPPDTGTYPRSDLAKPEQHPHVACAKSLAL